MTCIAENIVQYMLGVEPLLEDRLDDYVAKFGMKIPGETPEAKRHTLEQWASYDSTRNKKYFPWYFKQYLAGKIKMDEHTLDHIRDLISSFEHYITMPAFQDSRDIFQYDYKGLEKVVRDNATLMSKKDVKRGKERLGGTVLNKVGVYEVVGFRDGSSLAQEAWRAYSPENPNWDGEPKTPDMPEYSNGYPDYPPGTTEPYSIDNLWCIRKPSRGADYINKSPSKMFYVVRKNGWPYVGAELGSWASQIVSLHNRQIDTGMVEEIYDVFKPVLDEFAKNGWDTGGAAKTLFGKLRVIRGELQAGETIPSMDLSGSSLKNLPDNLTVSGDFNVSNTQLTQLPKNLTVQGSLAISNTKIKELPEGLTVKGSLNMSGTGLTRLPDNMTIGNLDVSNTKIAQLPAGLKVTEVLKINGTPITALPRDLVAGKILYSPEMISQEEIRTYFCYRREVALKAHFWKSPKTATMTEEQKEAAWPQFKDHLLRHFQTSQPVGRAISAMFEPVATEKAAPKTRRR